MTNSRGTLRVLCVDDEPSVLRALRRVLRQEPYEIVTASNGAEAVAYLEQDPFAAIVCDQRMPGLSGAEVLAEARRLRPDAIRITLTGFADLQAVIDTVNEGQISYFLVKPWDDEHLRRTLRDATGRFAAEQEVTRLNEVIRTQRDELCAWSAVLEQKVLERTAALEDAYDETLGALVSALDAREQSTAGHSRRVAMFALTLALRCGLPDDEWESLYRGALLHDIGKIGIPDAVLLKPGRLNDAERAIVETHVIVGAQILESIGSMRDARAIPLHHHERFDGTGYPKGLAGETIPIAARIFAVADVYDALRSARPYKAAMTHDEAAKIIRDSSGSHFDPAIVAAFNTVAVDAWNAMCRDADECSSYRAMLLCCRTLIDRGSSRAA